MRDGAGVGARRRRGVRASAGDPAPPAGVLRRRRRGIRRGRRRRSGALHQRHWRGRRRGCCRLGHLCGGGGHCGGLARAPRAPLQLPPATLSGCARLSSFRRCKWHQTCGGRHSLLAFPVFRCGIPALADIAPRQACRTISGGSGGSCGGSSICCLPCQLGHSHKPLMLPRCARGPPFTGRRRGVPRRLPGCPVRRHYCRRRRPARQ